MIANHESGDNAPKNNERVYRQLPTISSLQDLLAEMPVEKMVLVDGVADEVRTIIVNVVKAGGVIFIGDIAKKVTKLSLRPDEDALKQFIALAADKEMRASGVDLKAAIIHRCIGSTSRYYMQPEMEGTALTQARRDWAAALEKVHKHFSEGGDEQDDFDIPEESAA